MIRFSELIEKEVISCGDGARLGFVDDLFIDEKTGKIISLIVPECAKSIFSFKRGDEWSVEWCEIEKMGEDIILVNKQTCCAERIKRKYSK